MDSIQRLGLLIELVDRRIACRERVGKTVVQKLLYLLQEYLGMRIDYGFRFYTYGPYSSAIMGDLDYAVALKALDQNYDSDEGFDFKLGPSSKQFSAIRSTIRKNHGSRIDELFGRFGKLSARELELRATVVFIKNRDRKISPDELLKRIKSVKPKYSDDEIRAAANEFGGGTSSTKQQSRKPLRSIVRQRS